MKQRSIARCSILRLLTLAVCSSSLDLRRLMWSYIINTAVLLPCCFLLAGFVVECGATITGHCRRRLRHISPDQGPRLMCKCKMKQFPWGRAVLITKFEVDSSYNCVFRTLCPNAPIMTAWYWDGPPFASKTSLIHQSMDFTRSPGSAVVSGPKPSAEDPSSPVSDGASMDVTCLSIEKCRIWRHSQHL